MGNRNPPGGVADSLLLRAPDRSWGEAKSRGTIRSHACTARCKAPRRGNPD